MLWLSLHFPRLALDHLLRAEPGSQSHLAVALSYTQGRQSLIHSCTAAARQHGVVPGMSTSAALRLCHTLRVRPLDEAQESAALSQLASQAMQYTPAISLQPPDGLLLEIGGSADLFGGLAALHGRIRNAMGERGYQHTTAIAPTSLAAWLLSRAGQHAPVTDTAQLAAALRPLPVTLLPLTAREHDALRGMGLHRIGDCLRLPRDEAGRRLGTALFDLLDRALGHKPDPRLPWRPPARFATHLVLPGEVSDSAALLFATRRLIEELTDCLRAGNHGIRRFELRLTHADGTHSEVPFQLAGTTRDTEHLLLMLRTRLETFRLPGPVEEIHLAADQLIELGGRNQELFASLETENESWVQLINHLRMRLGEPAVRELHTAADHRPEKAWQDHAPLDAGDPPPGLQRPLWLLEQPLPLEVRDRQPCLGGALTILRGPERIEAGWWDGTDTARDYYVACNPGQQQFWIYRQQQATGGWYLHGLFA